MLHLYVHNYDIDGTNHNETNNYENNHENNDGEAEFSENRNDEVSSSES